MKALRIVAVIIGGVVILIALVFVLALMPAVQTWAVHKAVGNQPGLRIEVGRVAAGFSAADLTNIRLVKDGMVITANHANARYSAWDFINHRKITVDDLTVDGLVIDLRGAKPAATAAGTQPTSDNSPAPAPATRASASAAPTNAQPGSTFNGLLSAAKLPYDIRIARFSVPGRIILSDVQSGTFEVRGSDITTGQHGTVDWKADLTNTQPGAPYQTLHTAGTVAVHLTTERRIDVLDVNGNASAEGPNLPSDQLKLEVKAEQPAAGGNEGYNAQLSLVHGSSTEPLLTMAGQYDANGHQITGVWNASIRNDQLAAFLSGLGLPDTAINGSGKFSARPDTNAASASGDVQCDLSHLEKISPELTPIGRVRLRAKFDGNLADNVAHLTQFSLDAAGDNGRQLAQIHTLQPVAVSLADKRVSFNDPKSDLARITVQALPLAWAQPFASGLKIESGDLSLTLAVAADPDGSAIRVTSPEPLALRNVTVSQGNQKLVDRLTLTAKPQIDYTAARIHAEVNEIAATTGTGDTMNGKVAADVTHPAREPSIAFTAELSTKVVGALQPFVSARIDPFTVVTKSDGTLAGSVLQINHASVAMSRADNAPMANFILQQAVSLNLQTKAVAPANPGAKTVELRITGMPLALAQPFVPNSKLEGQIVSATVEVVMKSLDDLSATTAEPLNARGVSVTMNNQPMLQNVDLAVDFSASKQGETVKYDVRKLEVKQGNASLASLAVSGDAKLGAKPTLSAKGSFTADAAGLSHQPALATAATLSQGKIDATFDTAITETIRAQAKVAAHGLVAKQDNRALGDAELTVNATVQSDGSSVLAIPFTLTNGGRKSDLAINGKLSRSGNRVTFDGKITSSALYTDDLMPLAALAPSSANQGTAAARPVVPAGALTGALQSPPPASPAHDTVPFWNAFAGKIDVDLKQITYGQSYVISGVTGTASVTPTQLALTPFGGQFKNNPFKVAATIDFDGQQSQPYTLSGSANFQNVDVGALLQPFNPNEKPKLETTATVDAKLDGKGGTVADLLQHIYGKFDLTGSKGVFRGLSGLSANAVSGVAGLLGQLNPNSQGYAAVGDLLGKLAELNFDKFAMHAERGTDLNIKVTQIDFVSPDTRLSGSGTITNQPGVPIQNQPMQFTLQLAGKDQMAFAMKRAGILGTQTDAEGYQQMSTAFQLRGSPAKPDPKDLGRIVAAAAANAFLGTSRGQNVEQNLGNALQKLLGGH